MSPRPPLPGPPASARPAPAHRAARSRSFRFRPRVFALGGSEAPSGEGLAGALERLADRRRPILFDSAAGSPCRVSLLAFDPLVPAAGASPEEGAKEGEGERAPRSLAEVAALWARLARDGGDRVPGPFAGGWAGALAYDLGVAGEALDLPPEPWGLPPVVGGLYTDFLVRDEEAGRTWLVLGEEPGDGRPPVAERRERVVEALRGPAPPHPFAPRGELERCVDGAEHRARVERLRGWIAAGELYQANLAHRFVRPVAGSPVGLYRALRRRNPAPYMGYASWGSQGEPEGLAAPGALLSSSPELLLELEGARARTRPIKGTSPRDADPARDAASARALLASEKDRAELGMIVDLERNDLARIAEPGSVRVKGFPSLESYASVHHLAADVVARPKSGVGPFDVLAALFPGGSITGAPKLRSMELIAELEGEGRGFFTGSLGFVSLDGRALFNVLIRTLLWRPRPGLGPDAGEVSFRVGGGITWSSDPAAEERETLDKGAALARATGGPSGGEAAR